MRNLNNKGYTLVEILAVIVILGMLLVIVIPNVGNLINMNKENNIKQFNISIKNAAKLYISDYKYEITLVSNTCSVDETIDIDKIGDANNLNPNSQITIKTLVNEGYIKTSKDGNIYSPDNKEKKLNLSSSYIIVKYSCKTKDYLYNQEPVLIWE
jgi:prepilin-type N-terminal cleavage/methylation domain-containing protein